MGKPTAPQSAAEQPEPSTPIAVEGPVASAPLNAQQTLDENDRIIAENKRMIGVLTGYSHTDADADKLGRLTTACPEKNWEMTSTALAHGASSAVSSRRGEAHSERRSDDGRGFAAARGLSRRGLVVRVFFPYDCRLMTKTGFTKIAAVVVMLANGAFLIPVVPMVPILLLFGFDAPGSDANPTTYLLVAAPLLIAGALILAITTSWNAMASSTNRELILPAVVSLMVGSIELFIWHHYIVPK